MGVLHAHRIGKGHTRRCHLCRSRMSAFNRTVPDPPDPPDVCYGLAAVVAGAASAVLAGSRSCAAICEWAADLPDQHWVRIGQGMVLKVTTLRTLFACLDGDRLDRGAWGVAVDTVDP